MTVANHTTVIRRFPVPVHRSCDHGIVGGVGAVDDLSESEEHLLDVLADVIGPCPACGVDHRFLAFWSPERNPVLAVCLCGTLLWSAAP